MQKKLIALAVAGLVAAPAFAQSNVTIYGRVDYGFQARSGDSGAVPDVKTKTEFAPGMQGGSRLGFKGAEDLGNGLKAIFELEFGSLRNDVSDSAQMGNRHAYVGLTGGFGTVVGGRLDGVRYGIFNKYDPFHGGEIGNVTQITAQVDRADNAVAYISPDFGGMTVLLAYASQVAGQENAGNIGDGRLNTIMLAYSAGPIAANVDFERVITQGNDAQVRVFTLGGSYDLGVVKLSALYDILKRDDANGDQISDVRTWLLGAEAPVTDAVLVKVAYARTKDKELANDPEISKWGVGAQYNLSKRTNVYTSYGSINNDDNTTFVAQINPAANSQLGGYGTRGFNLGIAHKF